MTIKTLLSNWEIVAGSVALVWAIVSFVLTRRRELAWKRTEFIIQQLGFLDNDTEMRECTLIIYGKHHNLRVDDFLVASLAKNPINEGAGQLVMKFEKYLNFLWRIAYAHIVLKTITRKDLDAFGAYFDAVQKNEKLRKYCLDEGYEEIVTASELL